MVYQELFYNNCLLSRALIGSFLSSIRVQTDKIGKLGLARAALCKWPTCARQTCLSKPLFIPGIWPVSGLVIVKNKLTPTFLCVCPLIEDKFRHNIVKVCCRITCLRFVVPQLLWQCYDAIYHQQEDRRIKNWRQFVKLTLSCRFNRLSLRLWPPYFLLASWLFRLEVRVLDLILGLSL